MTDIKSCLVYLFLLATIEARSVSDELATESKKEYTCLYDGVKYQEGDELPTKGRCWHCTCREGFVEPGPEFCARISCPMNENLGCEPVYDKDECCPASFNCDNSSSSVTEDEKCKCNLNYFKHYKTKQCEPVYEEGCECPVRFDCPNTFLENDTVCYYNGNTYKEGESIESSNPCQKCSCTRSFVHTGVQISCISVECPSVFGGPPLKDGCYEVHSLDECCPIGRKCDNPSDSNSTSLSEATCELDGKIYHLGQMMYPSEDPCLMCVCDEHWTGPSGNSCRILDCMLEEKKADLQSGCLPIYHEGSCCPIEFHCEDFKEEEEVISLNKSVPLSVAQEGEKDPLKQCVFGKKRYNLGDVLDIKHPTNCVTCTCSTPPDFTCIHKSCPRPPNNDYENCRPTYMPGQCCPVYNCIHQAPIFQVCDPVYCSDDCYEVMVPYGCPMCMCQEVLCSIPRCSSDCVIDYNAKPCPTCKCAETIPLDRPMCGPVKCGPQCHEAISPQGCPMCVCGPLCSPPKCRSGCQVQTNVPEGQCPNCVCHDDSLPPERAHKVLCSPVKCPSFCSEATGEHGCPMCLCDPLCSPPKCDPGCRAEVVPSSGPCPGCVCDVRVSLQCSPVKCPAGCTEYALPNACPVCECQDVLCSIPNCPAGCEINTAVAPGTCPDCKCPPTIPLDRPMCDPVKCGPQCYEAVSPQGCPMCICGPLCSPPKCDPGCRVQVDVPEGQCPGCDCPGDGAVSDRATKVLCSPVRCPLDCSEATGPNGCPMCLCQPLCSPPKCDPGCEAEVVPSSGPCPGCVCNRGEPLCSPVLCGPDCYQTVSQQGCPTCVCDPQCTPLICLQGCYVQRRPGDQCPTCVCPLSGESAPDYAPMVHPSPVQCQPSCRPVMSDSGIPGCVCEAPPLCSPPKCAAGCRMQSIAAGGPCPGCVCDNDETEFLWCPPVKCKEGCREVTTENRCPSCMCGNECEPLKCPETCYLETDSPPGTCPGCKCPYKKPQIIECPDMPCELPCMKVKLTPNSCPICQCGPSPEKSVIPPTISG